MREFSLGLGLRFKKERSMQILICFRHSARKREMFRLEEVEVEWYGPYKIDTALNYFHEDENYGLYMITRRWGKKFREKILLYRHDLQQRF